MVYIYNQNLSIIHQLQYHLIFINALFNMLRRIKMRINDSWVDNSVLFKVSFNITMYWFYGIVIFVRFPLEWSSQRWRKYVLGCDSYDPQIFDSNSSIKQIYFFPVDPSTSIQKEYCCMYEICAAFISNAYFGCELINSAHPQNR